ncbi:large-conductance mechanosensitive channel [Nocardia brasiliensis NBRC 14402]|uniref:large conductance mechanosensitive channel protein MscL n=1 Tax=Nocardia brasiliensis TaxID=37326 RepID=UPI00031114B7|nr:large conductance mechanosensitive channel protein MscL [Nocardia brasiliensis]ASF11317.1 large conductance mechanosensitive channel protein MscL [Nocardia brasiliensis]GAJ86982.1 large-conductance mechanosensitive channel [Nocardia brasiliensis NBRC 14402]SUB09958.1 Large-conductance mechanosensitive channel [Nocardia brasiliensis]
MLKGFKEFLMRGNVIDLAVAVVMGTAFTTVVTSVTKGVINPLLAVFGSTNELGLGVQLISSKPATFIQIGPIITAFINFVVVAAVLYFVLMVPMKTIKNRFGTTKAAEPTETELLIEIRDLLAERHDEVRKQRAADRAVEAEVDGETAGRR